MPNTTKTLEYKVRAGKDLQRFRGMCSLMVNRNANFSSPEGKSCIRMTCGGKNPLWAILVDFGFDTFWRRV